jgi:uncharacterized membrane protein
VKKKRFTKFVVTTVIGGVIFLVPLVILAAVAIKAVEIMKMVAEPMATWLPVDTVGGVALANVIAVVGLVALCFLGGLVARHAFAGALMEKLESKVLVNLPGYVMIKKLVSGFDERNTDGLRPVVLQLGSAERIGFEIQKLPDNRSVVFIPSAPNPYSGITQVLPADQVTYLEVPVGSILEVTENFGHGMPELLARRKESNATGSD